MLESVRKSPLDAAGRASPFGNWSRSAGDGLSINERRGLAVVEVAAFGRGEAVAEALSNALGIALPPAGMSAETGNMAALSVGPGRWFIIAPEGAAGLAALPGDQAAVTDLSHGRAVLSLSGPRPTHTLMKGTAVDLDPAIFMPGAVAATALARMPAIIWRRQANYDVIIPRSYAVSLLEWLVEAGGLS